LRLHLGISILTKSLTPLRPTGSSRLAT
jgi:hypothetical protein